MQIRDLENFFMTFFLLVWELKLYDSQPKRLVEACVSCQNVAVNRQIM